MGNHIFKTVLNRKIENFVSSFVDDSRSIFFDNNKLIHPGEYGKYREMSLKDLLKHITKHKISDGFVLTPNDLVSTQLDVVIYKNDEAPILENNYIDFFSIESVIAIGEVKSTLTKTELKTALIKLSEAKKLNDHKKGFPVDNSEISKENDNIISFLVCKDLSFDLNTLDFESIYENTDRKHRHNFILVIEKGLILYEFKFTQLNTDDKTVFTANNGNIEATVWYAYPYFSFNNSMYETNAMHIPLDANDKFYHIQLFLSMIAVNIKNSRLYHTDFTDYMDLPKAPIFK